MVASHAAHHNMLRMAPCFMTQTNTNKNGYYYQDSHESQSQEETARAHTFKPTWPQQWIIYTYGSSTICKCCS